MRYMTYKDKVEVGIKFIENNNLLGVDKFYTDGSSDNIDFVVSFYDDGNLKEQFKKLRVYD